MHRKPYGIIYKATSPSKKVYIGQTRNTLKSRKIHHEWKAQRTNQKLVLFHKALSKYGNDKFTWEIIDMAYSKQSLDKKEEKWIKFYKSNALRYNYGYGYNLTDGGGARKMFRLTDIHKKKIGESNSGRIFSPEIRKKFGPKSGKPSWISGKTKDNFTIEHRNNLIEGQKKRRENPNYIPPNLGKIRTSEQRERISIATKKAMQNPIIKAKCSHTYTPEQKEKISKATKEAMQRPEVKEKIRISRLNRIYKKRGPYKKRHSNG